MIGFFVELNKEDIRRWVKALDSIEWRAKWWLKEKGGEFNRRCAVEYANRVSVNILSNKWSFMPYTETYSKWKHKIGLGSNPFWKLKGDLVASMTQFQERGGWVGGIPANILDSGGKSWYGNLDKGKSKPLAMIATVLEYGGDYRSKGGGYHFPRPILSNTLNEFEEQNYSGIVDTMMNDIERLEMSIPLKILDVKPVGFRVVIEHDLEDLKKLALAINCAEFNIIKVKEEERSDVTESVNWIINKFFPELKKFLKEIENGS